MSGTVSAGGSFGHQWARRSHDDRQSTSADQVEWQAVLHGIAHVAAGTMDEEMTEEADQEIAEDVRTRDPLEGKNRVMELAQGGTAEIILLRKQQLGDAYPFKHIQNSLHYEPPADQLPLYELLLGTSQAQSLTTGPFTALPRLFEQLSKLAGMAFLGPTARGFHTGWPRPDEHSRFKAVVEQLRIETGMHYSEWEWRPGSYLPVDPVPALIKDGGLDIVAWRPWEDQRTAQLYLLGQCACGADWLNKTKDLDMQRLAEWFAPPRVTPLRSFFTPHYALNSILQEHSLSAGLMFDRVRILHMLREPHISKSVDALKDEIQAALAIAKQELPPKPKRKPHGSKKVRASGLAKKDSTGLPDTSKKSRAVASANSSSGG